MYLYTPPKALPGDGNDEPMRIATLTMQQPTPAPLPPVEKAPEPPPPAATPQPTPQQVVHATPAPTKSETKAVSQPQASTNLTKKNDPGKSANAAPNKNTKGPREVTSPKQGGAVKTTDTAGSQFNSPRKDVSKIGAFSTFGAGGAQNRIDTATAGAGGLAGDADQATGKAGYAENRPGEGLGFKMKDTGRGGTGNALTGIEGGIGTQGRGSGISGYGSGGLGEHAGAKITFGGTGESFSGTIDREAIRRVIQANLRVIRTCYERELNRNPNLLGKIVISWEIGPEGRVLSASTKSNELGNDAVAQCVIDRLKTWRFPEPPAGQVVDVAYPFFFSN
jgi:outer membrane biosynthesis protein TonB